MHAETYRPDFDYQPTEQDLVAYAESKREWFERDGRPCERPVHIVSEHVATYSYQDTCQRCGGAGGGEQWSRTGWKCYECGGDGKGKIRTVKVYSAEKLAKLDAAAAKREGKRQEKLAAERSIVQAKLAAWREEHTGALATIAAQATRSPFLASLIEQAEARPLSAAQIEAGLAATERERIKTEQEKRQEWIAQPGARIDFEWTVERVIELSEGGWGNRGFYEAARYLVLGRDSVGNIVKYIGSGHFPKEGETARTRATVKSHDTYKGIKQTTIERLKVVSN